VPSYQVPSVFVRLAAMPLTPSGKLDRAALPAPAPSAAEPDYRAASPAESRLCDLFAEILGVPVGPDDDFFELGGDSLTAMRLVSGIQSELGTGLEILDLTTHPTPAALARRLPESAAEPAPGRTP
jgi:acyl carrier protein